MLKLQIEKRIPDQLTEIIHCIAFWNTNGQRIFSENKAGNLGDKGTQQFAKDTPFEDWLIEMIKCDCITYTKDKGYKAGRGGSHVWVSDSNNERILMIF